MATSGIQFDVRCASCGYNLRGLPRGGTCPECGETIPTGLTPAVAPAYMQDWASQMRNCVTLVPAGWIVVPLLLVVGVLCQNMAGKAAGGVTLIWQAGSLVLFVFAAGWYPLIVWRLTPSRLPNVPTTFAEWLMRVLTIVVCVPLFVAGVRHAAGNVPAWLATAADWGAVRNLPFELLLLLPALIHTRVHVVLRRVLPPQTAVNSPWLVGALWVSALCLMVVASMTSPDSPFFEFILPVLVVLSLTYISIVLGALAHLVDARRTLGCVCRGLPPSDDYPHSNDD